MVESPERQSSTMSVRDKKEWLQNVFKKDVAGAEKKKVGSPASNQLVQERHKWIASQGSKDEDLVDEKRVDSPITHELVEERHKWIDQTLLKGEDKKKKDEREDWEDIHAIHQDELESENGVSRKVDTILEALKTHSEESEFSQQSKGDESETLVGSKSMDDAISEAIGAASRESTMGRSSKEETLSNAPVESSKSEETESLEGSKSEDSESCASSEEEALKEALSDSPIESKISSPKATSTPKEAAPRDVPVQQKVTSPVSTKIENILESLNSQSYVTESSAGSKSQEESVDKSETTIEELGSKSMEGVISEAIEAASDSEAEASVRGSRSGEEAATVKSSTSEEAEAFVNALGSQSMEGVISEAVEAASEDKDPATVEQRIWAGFRSFKEKQRTSVPPVEKKKLEPDTENKESDVEKEVVAAPQDDTAPIQAESSDDTHETADKVEAQSSAEGDITESDVSVPHELTNAVCCGEVATEIKEEVDDANADCYEMAHEVLQSGCRFASNHSDDQSQSHKVTASEDEDAESIVLNAAEDKEDRTDAEEATEPASQANETEPASEIENAMEPSTETEEATESKSSTDDGTEEPSTKTEDKSDPESVNKRRIEEKTESPEKNAPNIEDPAKPEVISKIFSQKSSSFLVAHAQRCTKQLEKAKEALLSVEDDASDEESVKLARKFLCLRPPPAKKKPPTLAEEKALAEANRVITSVPSDEQAKRYRVAVKENDCGVQAQCLDSCTIL